MFPALIFGLLQDSTITLDIGATTILCSALLLAFFTRVVTKATPGRSNHAQSFDGLSAFVGLGSMYAASFGDYGVIWLILLIAGIFGIFYLSIIAQNKDLLGSASLFLILSVITISFRYFSGYGITTSLIMATIGLLGSAAVATTINKRYFGHPTVQVDQELPPQSAPSEAVVISTPAQSTPARQPESSPVIASTDSQNDTATPTDETQTRADEHETN